MRNKRYIYEFDFIRTICAFSIVFYHFMAECGLHEIFPSRIGSYYLGDAVVTVFFALSGAVLYLGHPSVDHLKEFYRKRWLAIFPSFYIAYLIFDLILTIRSGAPIFSGIPLWRFILTLSGLDGYTLYLGNNFYILGEWFTGALVILYLLYPLLVKNKKCLPYLFILSLFFYLFSIYHPLDGMEPFRNIFSCLTSFIFGIWMMQFIRKASVFWFSLLSLLFLSINLVPVSNTGAAGHLAGFAASVVLFHLGHNLIKQKALRTFFNHSAKITYQVFLVQHIVIVLVLMNHRSTMRLRSLFGLTLLEVIAFSFLVYFLQNHLTHLFQKI